MRFAEAGNLQGGFGIGKKVAMIRAEQGKRIGAGQFVPKAFQLDGAGVISFLPEERDHLPESAHARGIS